MEATVYNPNGAPIETLPVIYGFNNGGEPGWLHAVLLAEDGTCLGGHVCSHECYMPGDLGVSVGFRPDRHQTFQTHYPQGYRMEFVGYDEVPHHAKLNAAFAASEALLAAQKDVPA